MCCSVCWSVCCNNKTSTIDYALHVDGSRNVRGPYVAVYVALAIAVCVAGCVAVFVAVYAAVFVAV